ncbi:hypothetical protein ALC60_04655, partial [Trachymyrmex zeteki]
HIEQRRVLEDAREIVLEQVRDAIERHGSVKVNTAFNGEFVANDKRANKSINTKNIEINPMRAGCHVEVPRDITTKRAVISVRTTDNACFAWSVVAALYPTAMYTERESSYPYYTTVLNLQNREDASSYTYRQHEVCSIDYYVRCSYDDALSSYRFRRDEDCIAWFARQLQDLAHCVKDIVSNVPMETLSKQFIFFFIDNVINKHITTNIFLYNYIICVLLSFNSTTVERIWRNGSVSALKVCLYEFHHEYMLPLYNDKCNIMYTDTARTITFDDYTRCLNEEIEMTRRQSCIRFKLHEVYTIFESKIALNPYDDKRYVVPDSTETLPWGIGGYLCNIIYYTYHMY